MTNEDFINIANDIELYFSSYKGIMSKLVIKESKIRQEKLVKELSKPFIKGEEYVSKLSKSSSIT